MAGQLVTEAMSREVLEDLEGIGAIRKDGHYVYTAGDHGSVYVNKDALYPHVRLVRRYTGIMAQNFIPEDVQVVLGAALGAIILQTWVTFHLLDFNRNVLGVYAEQVNKEFRMTRGYGQHLTDRRVLIVEDVINSGKTVKKMAALVREHGGEVVGIGALVNRGTETAESLGVPKLVTLLDYPAVKHPPDDCPLCRAGVPINTDVGKGRDFLAAKGATLAT